MGFETPDHDTMARYRDEAEAAHKAYWSGNNYSPTGLYFPGFEKGWNDACAALSSGNQVPDDIEQWAVQRAEELGQTGDNWEWRHGFKAGVEKAREAGQN